MTTYYFYNKETKRLTPAPKVATIDGALVVNPTAEQYAAMGGDDPEKGAYPLAPANPPTPPEGKIALVDGYELSDGEWAATYRYEDAPPPPPRCWTRHALMKACGDKWETVKAALVEANLYDAFLTANEILEDDPDFVKGIAWAKATYGEETVEEILAAAEEM